mmetsp:Transcript_80730/g.251026  ORF Transcript_80730/g.251026 Transcript_80730/m.251026 type:complete len:197 (+) Transcript_80730:82-672(+)
MVFLDVLKWVASALPAGAMWPQVGVDIAVLQSSNVGQPVIGVFCRGLESSDLFIVKAAVVVDALPSTVHTDDSSADEGWRHVVQAGGRLSRRVFCILLAILGSGHPRAVASAATRRGALRAAGRHVGCGPGAGLSRCPSGIEGSGGTSGACPRRWGKILRRAMAWLLRWHPSIRRLQNQSCEEKLDQQVCICWRLC